MRPIAEGPRRIDEKVDRPAAGKQASRLGFSPARARFQKLRTVRMTDAET